MIDKLISSHLIAVNPDTEIERIQFYEDGSFDFNKTEVSYQILYDDSHDSLGSFYTNLEAMLPSLLLANVDEFWFQIRQISVEECLAYLDYTLDRHNIYYEPGTKTWQVLEQCLNDFSVAQIYNFIWRVSRDAAAYYMRENISKKQAANSVVSRLNSLRECAISQNWEVKSFRRDFNLLQSTLSRLVFNSILQTDDGGFNVRLDQLFSN